MRPKILIIRAGTWIVCPECKSRLAQVATDLFTGSSVNENCFEGEVFRNGDRAVSKCCRASWFYNGRLSTDLGWLPEITDQN